MKVYELFIIFITFNNLFSICLSRSYINFTLYSTTPKTKEQLYFLQNLNKHKYVDLKFWKKPYKLFGTTQFIVNPIDKDLLLERAEQLGLDLKVVLPDLQSAIDLQLIQQYPRPREKKLSWEYYHTLDDIYQWLSETASKFANISTLYTIGRSVEGREIYALTVKYPGASKYQVIVEGCIHGNEWVSAEFVTYFINEILNANQSNNEDLKYVAYKYVWNFIPIVNPDGFEFTHTKDRFWSKNTNKYNINYGVDLNRNFGFHFKNMSTIDPTDDDFCGTHAFSEPETIALTSFILHKVRSIKYYFAIHSYGQHIIIPYSDRSEHIENFTEMENFAKQAVMEIYRKFQSKYYTGTAYNILGTKFTGTSTDYVKRTFSVKYVVTFVLRDEGQYGYALPSSQILPACREAMTGIVHMMTTRPKYVLVTFNGAQKNTQKLCSHVVRVVILYFGFK